MEYKCKYNVNAEAVLYCDGDEGKGYWNVMTQIQIFKKREVILKYAH